MSKQKESISLRELEDYIENNLTATSDVDASKLLTWARQQAKKEAQE